MFNVHNEDILYWVSKDVFRWWVFGINVEEAIDSRIITITKKVTIQFLIILIVILIDIKATVQQL